MRTIPGWIISFLCVISCGAGLLMANAGVNIGGANMDDKNELQDRNELWHQVAKAKKDRLPKTEMKLLESVYQLAYEDKQYPEAIRALCQKIVVEASINQPAAPFGIKKLIEQADQLPSELKPMANAILAKWFYQYYQDNRWKFAQRSQTSSTVSDDFETWGLRRLLQEIDQAFTKSLANKEALKEIPLADYDQLFRSGTVAENHRPTVFDFIANEAIQFYSLDEQIIRKQGAFNLSADSPVLADASEFIAWKPATEDGESYVLRAVQLYQELLAFHQQDADQTAFLDADLNRIEFANNIASGEEKKSRYRALLNRYASEHTKHPLSSRALSLLAASHVADKEYKAAHPLASAGMKRFPESYGGKRCADLIAQIERPELALEAEGVWNEAKPEFIARYRNLNKVHFRLVKFDYEKWKFGRYGSPANFSYQDRKGLKNLKPFKSWNVDLQVAEDYQYQTQDLKAPLEIPGGSYLLLASSKPTFEADDNFLLVEHVWKSDLAHVDDGSHQRKEISGQVMHAITGKPISGASVLVDSWKQDGRNSRMISTGSTTTDVNGIYRVAVGKEYSHRVLINHQQQTLGLISKSNYHGASNETTTHQTHFFTDRSIYRPGQTIHFKGICTSSDRKSNKYSVVANKKVAVELRDVNNQVVETLNFTTNKLGSFAGSFTAPKNRATGSMTLRTSRGSAQVRVEEYKRPKFQVEIDPPEKAYSLNETVKLTGNATAYTGAAIDGAKVTYRVVRSVNYPSWWYWRCWWMPRNNNSQQIVNKTVQTKADGTFEIEFKALPDKSASAQGQPTFTYQVYADVTDTAGETRSATQSVNVGFTSMQAGITADSWLVASEPVGMKVSTTTLDGVPQVATGTLKIFALTPPDQVQRTTLLSNHYNYLQSAKDQPPQPDLSNYRQWATGDVVTETELTTDEKGMVKTDAKLAAGAYKVTFESADPNGNAVTAETFLLVIDPNAKMFDLKIPDHFAASKTSCEPGETFEAIWGTGYDQGQAFVEIFHRHERVKGYWTDPGKTLEHLEIPIQEKHRGGLNLFITFVRDNRLYTHQQRIDVPWSNKRLKVKWEHFVSNLQPGGKETWTATVTPPSLDDDSSVNNSDAQLAAIEMVAAMYDSSLDQFMGHSWNQALGSFYGDHYYRSASFSNLLKHFSQVASVKGHRRLAGSRYYRRFRHEMMMSGARPRMSVARGAMMSKSSGVAPMAEMDFEANESLGEASLEFAMQDLAGDKKQAEGGEEPGEDLSKVAIRKNLNETAFFFPNLMTDKDGTVKIEFEVPEALTTWKFMGLAHDADLRTGMLVDEMTTSKDLMVQPNPPRFLREGDQLFFSVKVTNQSDNDQQGTVQLMLKDAFNEEDINEKFGNQKFQQPFNIPAKESRSYYFEIAVPDFVGAIVYKAVAGNEAVSDGEEGFLPVLSKRILVTESLPLPIRGNQTRTFDFATLEKIDTSDSLQSQTLNVQMTSNPSWYAVMALPYLMEYPHQCSEQTFNRIYANALGNHIVGSNDRIKTIFDQWRGTDALNSPLEKNDDLRNVLIAESPWLAAGKDESQARRNVGNLFDNNRMQNEITRAIDQLKQMQMSDGAWPWFSGGRANDYLTLYITTGFGRLRKLGVEIDMQPAMRSIDRLDWWINKRYSDIKQHGNLNRNNLDSTIALYLYGRTFFLKEKPVNDQYQTAFDYFVGQAKTHWAKLDSRQPQGHVAIALKRLGDSATAKAIMKSLTERSLSNDEMGQFWREETDAWFWYRAPIETQALMIEAYDEVLDDKDSVEELKIWLLKQKQTQNWKTTKSTADAVYALLLRGTDPLTSSKLVSVKLGGDLIKPDKVEAGTGFYQKRFAGGDIKSAMRKVEVAKSDDGIAWGNVTWQYLEDVSKIEPYEGTPLTIKKGLFLKKNTDAGPEISPLTGPAEVGDELVTRVEIRVDRDMEYVHLKDYRGSGTEPTNVLSRYKVQDGLWYYESTRDTASHFFIDYLPRGTYVFESSVRVQHKGKYQTGIAEIQCMYAPEFNSHSNSVSITVE